MVAKDFDLGMSGYLNNSCMATAATCGYWWLKDMSKRFGAMWLALMRLEPAMQSIVFILK